MFVIWTTIAFLVTVWILYQPAHKYLADFMKECWLTSGRTGSSMPIIAMQVSPLIISFSWSHTGSPFILASFTPGDAVKSKPEKRINSLYFHQWNAIIIKTKYKIKIRFFSEPVHMGILIITSLDDDGEGIQALTVKYLRFVTLNELI